MRSTRPSLALLLGSIALLALAVLLPDPSASCATSCPTA